MFYVAPETEGAKLASKPLLVAVTAGNVQHAYAADGANLFPLRDLLKPLQATANRCALAWEEPFLIYNAHKADDEALQAAGEHYARRLGRLGVGAS